jgi:TRAP-type C4-dicarboxylate transport system substrate-binding protein
MFRSKLTAAIASLGLAFSTLPAVAQDVTLRMHQFLPPQAGVPANILIPWAEKVEAESDGRLKIEVFSAMALGGKPPELIDQVRDGVVDIVWTLPGYTPGRFPRVEVFELPFTMTNAEAASRAYWELYEAEMAATEFADYKILYVWVHGPGRLHTKGEGVSKLEDMQGKKLRGPTRVINALLGELGSTPVGMPVPAIPEALSKGVIDGAVIPWEVTTALKIPELADSHTEFGGDTAFYTAAFVMAMNKASYNKLPDDLKAVIDANSGIDASGNAGRVMEGLDAAAREVSVAAGNTIHQVDGEELDRFKAVGDKVVTDWIAEMNEKDIDGAALVEQARALIAKHTN